MVLPRARRCIPAERQAAVVRLRFPNFTVQREGNRLVARGLLTPAPTSRDFRVRLEYKERDPPLVYLEDPPLQRNAKGEDPPHVFKEPGSPLCLYDWRQGEWTSGMYLAFTILPWTSEWLLFYEVWLAGHPWLGGGASHTLKRSDDGPLESEP